jgi:glutamate dehydrogenase (NAD(P)+)
MKGKTYGRAAGEELPLAAIMTLPCDVFIPAAVPDVITENTAKRLSCRYVVEAANGPTTPEGDRVLRDRGIIVLPDIYANGGAAPAG